MNYIIDRLGQDFAVCETEEQTMVTVDRHLLPEQAKEGDLIIYEDGAYRLDLAATAARRNTMKQKLTGLFE